MRHGKHTFKIGRTSSSRRSLIANMLKSLIEHERITTTVAKAKELKRHADRMVTLAKKNTLSSRRQANADLMISYNTLSPKEMRAAKRSNSRESYSPDRRVIGKLFTDLARRFAERRGGYTRIVRLGERAGDNAATCMLEYLPQ